jgi:hypothetical protein
MFLSSLRTWIGAEITSLGHKTENKCKNLYKLITAVSAVLTYESLRVLQTVPMLTAIVDSL